mmetsp:Transcript_50673/g.162177  ORF Transcript_50673/g.162177 Transcript_50673/m.162177 type:complete len:377 (+) Transcript_50673:953-2083(+)
MVTPDDMIAFMESQVALRIKMEPQESETAAYDAAWGAAFDGWMAPFKGQEAAAGEQAGEGQQEDRPPARALVVHAPGRQLRLELMSSSPRVFLCRDFLSPAECDAFVALGQQVSTRPHAWTNLELGMRNVVATGLRTKGTRAEGREGKLVALLEERVAALTGLPPGSQGERIQLSFSAPEAEASKCSIGLHVDANHQKHHRWATVLVYLNTLPQGCGGETVFPCAGGAGTEPARDAATQLFGAGLRNTAEAVAITVGEEGEIEVGEVEGATEAATGLVMASEDPARGLWVRPVKGSAVLFYTRDPKGAGVADPMSIHAGLSATYPGKWTLQVFDELPEKLRGGGGGEVRSFLERHVAPVDSGGTQWTPPCWEVSTN